MAKWEICVFHTNPVDVTAIGPEGRYLPLASKPQDFYTAMAQVLAQGWEPFAAETGERGGRFLFRRRIE